MEITPQLVDKLANLSRLEFDESSRQQIINDLREIISFFEKLQEVNTDGVEPLIHITEGANNLRKDEVENELTKDEALKNAPLHDGSHFKVPKVIKR